jgi:hypothetical protein
MSANASPKFPIRQQPNSKILKANQIPPEKNTKATARVAMLAVLRTARSRGDSFFPKV